jgi:hypothetical protein
MNVAVQRCRLLAHRDAGQALEFTVAIGGTADLDGRAPLAATDANDPKPTCGGRIIDYNSFRLVFQSSRIATRCAHPQIPERSSGNQYAKSNVVGAVQTDARYGWRAELRIGRRGRTV